MKKLTQTQQMLLCSKVYRAMLEAIGREEYLKGLVDDGGLVGRSKDWKAIYEFVCDLECIPELDVE